MKRNHFCIWNLLMTALALAGCQPKAGESAALEASVEIGPKYSAKNGLLVPEDTRLSLGLKVIEVTEQHVPATLDVQLRVYQRVGDRLLTSASVTLEEAAALKPGQAVRAAATGASFTGQVVRVDNKLIEATGMAEVLVEVRLAPGATGVGAFLPASVDLDPAAAAVTIPRAALLNCTDGHAVYAVSGGSFVRVPVKVGAIGGGLVEITEGLYEGDQVVLEPVLSLWLTELAAVKGGQACCVVPAKGK